VEKTEEAVRAEEGEELSPDPEAEQVEITAVEYEFENMPPTVGAGRVSFIMQNDGDEPHFMALAQLEEGVTVEEVLEAEAAGENPNQLIEREVGFSRTAKPGDESVLNANLEPGTYGMVCFIEAPDGKPHALKGHDRRLRGRGGVLTGCARSGRTQQTHR
jgi:hypothetical protein